MLLPSWHARSQALSYCAGVAASPDPNDPEAGGLAAERVENNESEADERLDPYSGRVFPREARTERLAAVVRRERGIENIVRARTWSAVQERCAESADTWEEALAAWKRKNAAARRTA